jgi:hypothetical protein
MFWRMVEESGTKVEKKWEWAVGQNLKREIYLALSAGREPIEYHLPGAMVECVWVGGEALPIVRKACVWWLLKGILNAAWNPAMPTMSASHRQKLLLISDLC